MIGLFELTVFEIVLIKAVNSKFNSSCLIAISLISEFACYNCVENVLIRITPVCGIYVCVRVFIS